MDLITGTTLYLASSKLDTRFGIATVHTFQDLISKEYSLVLTFGKAKRFSDKKSKILARIHSSCLTSETLRSFDSDDVQQLEGALKRFSKAKSGILYYFIQEGRGAGFLAKARDRMLVQNNPKISSQQAFKLCGLKNDYRNYDRIKDINQLLKINCSLILLTNNPDKFSSLKELGVKISKTERLLITPSAHSASYLESKQLHGHILNYKKSSRYQIINPPKPIKLFKPYRLDHANRFIHVASYRIPIKPVDGILFLKNSEWSQTKKSLLKIISQNEFNKIISTEQKLVDARYLVKINRSEIKEILNTNNSPILQSLLETPYWFTLHAYWDIASSDEFIVLEFCHDKKKTPLVRIQSESLFNRFPLEDMSNRDKYKKSLKTIVQAGRGFIVLLHNDGRGAGFGAISIEKMLQQKDLKLSSSKVYKKLGVPYDLRDYDAAALLMKHQLKSSDSIFLLSSSESSLRKKPESITCFKKAGIKIKNILFLPK
jgi:3,4-dihydroxy 2-butanone 4-phosphate synthase/GTP cyclohydrolase II